MSLDSGHFLNLTLTLKSKDSSTSFFTYLYGVTNVGEPLGSVSQHMASASKK